MNLKEIQLHGFKSFADKTVIRFEEGVTCIVGPNGCGKSNIADAVRWVLGEKSAKSLRGSNMQDVIFGGTVTRKPQTFSEVTLVFDNGKKIFSEYDTDTVSMTRRLYKNGDSKYLINGENSRLKDITNLFHSIGLGKEGYSIIGQGQVEKIMNARPEDRRLIFEEAMGLMNYKLRKEEVERKIDASKDNLYIYSQRIDEVERRMPSLKKQAEAAREYNEYAQSLKIQEANTYIYRFENAENEKNKFRKDIAVISDKIVSLNAQLERINRKLESNRDKITQADYRLSDLNDRRVELSVGNERKDGELKLTRERIGTYRNQIAAAVEFLAASKLRVGEIDDEIALANKRNTEGGSRIIELESQIEVLRSNVQSLGQKISLFDREWEMSRKSQLSTADEIAEMKKNLGSLAARMEAMRDKLNEIVATLKKVEERKERLSDELASVRKDLRNLKDMSAAGIRELEDKQEEMREMQLTVNDFNQELFSESARLAGLREQLEGLIGLKNRLEGYKESVRRLLSTAKTNPDLKKHLCGALADVVSTEQRYETAIETAFGGAMQNVVTPTADDAKYLIEYLKRTNGGVVTFLPVASMRPRPDSREIKRALDERGAMGLATELVQFDDYYYNVISNLLGNTLICDNIANATAIAKKYGNLFKIVTLDGDTVSTSGAMTGGSRGRNVGSLMSNERKIQECKDNIARKQKLIDKLKAAIAQSEEERKSAEAEVERLREKYQGATSEIAALTQRETALVQQIAEADADVQSYTMMQSEAKLKIKELEDEEASSSMSEEEIAKRRATAEADLERRRVENEGLKKELEEKNRTLQEMSAEYSKIATQLEQHKDTVDRLTMEKDDLVKKIVDVEAEKTEAEAGLEILEAEAAENELTEAERKAVEEVMEEISKITAEKETINAEQAALEEEKSGLQDTFTKHSEKRMRLELDLGRIDTNLENIRQHMEEDYGLDYEGCLQYRKEEFKVEEAASLISALKRKITILGAVNPPAVEEYEEESARCEEMLAQKADLQKALDDLQSALDEIRGEMLRIFNEGFHDFNENFKITFKELFGGGKAELQIDYEGVEDPLAAGVEIIACPPGKKLTKISLLSGGERALTAIAILFAILKSKPMPFCILDEIEAALDDANVDRFASYLKNFAQDTQFIVITHRKPTMNQADVLFGVTMQEKGVSKIVSVKLSEVESKLGAGTVE